jgi:hypothetical protein
MHDGRPASRLLHALVSILVLCGAVRPPVTPHGRLLYFVADCGGGWYHLVAACDAACPPPPGWWWFLCGVYVWVHTRAVLHLAFGIRDPLLEHAFAVADGKDAPSAKYVTLTFTVLAFHASNVYNVVNMVEGDTRSV